MLKDISAHKQDDRDRNVIVRIASRHPARTRELFRNDPNVLAQIAEMLPQPPLTRNQVALMEEDSTKSESERGFDQLDIAPRSLEEILPSLLRKKASL